MRINIFENLPVLHRGLQASLVANSLSIQGVYIPGSISFNTIAIYLSGSGGVSENLTIRFGLYSLNGSTLSLANSASLQTALSLGQIMNSILTLNTSATQDITPGNWYLGIVGETSLGGSFSMVGAVSNSLGNGTYGGPFIWGYYSASTTGLPASIATSDMIKGGGGAANTALTSYILISA